MINSGEGGLHELGASSVPLEDGLWIVSCSFSHRSNGGGNRGLRDRYPDI